MSASYENVNVSLIEGTSVKAEFDLRNRGSEPWRVSDAFAIGYHIFDADSGTLIEDGSRVAPARDVPPAECVHIHTDFDLPQEAGRYKVYISPMREDVCWYYERGWPFLLIDAVVEDAGARLERVLVTDGRAVRRERLVRSIGRAFVFPFITIWRNRSLIRVMVRRDVLGRYRGSFGGIFWTLLNPLLLMLTYFFVFGIVLNARFGNDPSRSGFALYFLAGMLPWLAFSEAAGRAPSVILEHRNFVKKLVFAVETLPFNLVVSGLVSEAFATLLFVLALLILRHGVPLTVLWLPALVIPQVLFTAGLAWFLAALGAFVRDLGQVIGFLLTLWFFLTPICYPESSVPALAIPVLANNPIFLLVRGYRAILLDGHAPGWSIIAKLWIAGAVLFVLGHAWFYKLRKSLPDVI
jgi:lipopolysaccharide transport system permease protein